MDAIEAGRPSPCSGLDGLVALVMATAAGLSAAERRWVDFEEVARTVFCDPDTGLCASTEEEEESGGGGGGGGANGAAAKGMCWTTLLGVQDDQSDGKAQSISTEGCKPVATDPGKATDASFLGLPFGMSS